MSVSPISSQVEMTQIVLPSHTNNHGTLFRWSNCSLGRYLRFGFCSAFLSQSGCNSIDGSTAFFCALFVMEWLLCFAHR